MGYKDISELIMLMGQNGYIIDAIGLCKCFNFFHF